MSSTNRGGERIDADFYPTPAWCVDALLNSMAGEYFTRHPVLDPCAGDGAILRAAQAYQVATHGIELRDVGPTPGTNTFLQADALTMGRDEMDPYVACNIVTNPPYSLAQRFIDRWRDRVQASAWLLRLNFVGSQKRAAWFRERPPTEILVLPKRPSFTGGKTDSCEYAWFIWQSGTHRASTYFDWLEVQS